MMPLFRQPQRVTVSIAEQSIGSAPPLGGASHSRCLLPGGISTPARSKMANRDSSLSNGWDPVALSALSAEGQRRGVRRAPPVRSQPSLPEAGIAPCRDHRHKVPHHVEAVERKPRAIGGSDRLFVGPVDLCLVAGSGLEALLTAGLWLRPASLDGMCPNRRRTRGWAPIRARLERDRPR